MKRKISNAFLLCALTVIASCGGSSGSSSGSGTGSGGSSSTGSCSSTLSGLTGSSSSSSYTSTGALSSITQTETCASSVVGDALSTQRATIEYNPTWDTEAKETFNEALASGENEDVWPDCGVIIPEPDQGEGPTCFGPRLYFQYHLDGDSRMSENCDSGICQLPIGDLGLWTDSEGDTGEACAAAKMNSDIKYVSGFTDMAKVVQSVVECLANNETITRPSSSTVDIKDAVNTAVQNEKLDFSAVTWTEASGVYTINLQVGESGSGGNVNIKTDKSGTPSIINVWGFFGGNDDGGLAAVDVNSYLAFSLYGAESGTATNMKFISAVFEGTEPDTATNGDVFDANNMIKLDSSWNMDHRTILMNDAGDGTSDKLMKYSWIAGNGAPSLRAPDSYSRTFMASVNAAKTAGVAYYGYGYGTDDAAERMTITNFICNWTGPNNDQMHDSAGPLKAQKQVLSKNSSGTWIASESLINYAPTRSCANDNNDGTPGGSADNTIDSRIDSISSDGIDFNGQPNDFGAASSAFTYGLTESMGEEVKISADDVELVDLTSETADDAFVLMTDPTATSL